MDPHPPGVHGICDSYLAQYLRLRPEVATTIGVGGHDDQLPDLSPDGHRAAAELARDALREISAARPGDEGERIAKAVFSERIGLQVEMHQAGLPEASLNVVASPAQDIRQVFDLMPTATAEDWAVIATRLNRVPQALAGYRQSLLFSADHGRAPASRQVRRVIEQCRTWAGTGESPSFFGSFAEAADRQPGVEGAIRSDLDTGVRAAEEAYAGLARFLGDEIAPRAVAEDAVGEDLYRLWSRSFIGAKLDLREAYEWGWSEFGRVETELAEVADRIRPGADPVEAAAALDQDSRYQVHGRTAFRNWMQELSDQALADLRDTHFTIPDELMTLECRIAPPGGGSGAYYTNPADDFSRPGQMWWSLPAGKDRFSTWREASTVYHEGVPGHHLQIGTAVATPELNRYQRLLCFVDGHGEGWALYAERLMQEFGYLDDGYLLGMLNKSLFRAARVIVDLGLHLKLEIPAGTGFHEKEQWTPDLAAEFLRDRTLTEPSRIVDEIERYLGWPGQAPAYKLGERLWLSLRDDVRARQGRSFDLRQFHERALRSGSTGLDTLKDILTAG